MNDRTVDLLQKSFRHDDPDRIVPPSSLAERCINELAQLPPRPRCTENAMALAQLRFIGWKLWLLQALLFLVFLALEISMFTFGSPRPERWLRVLSLLAVLLSFSMVPFTYRSHRYRMLEIEGAAWLSARRLLLLRVALFAALDLAAALALAAVAAFRFGLNAPLAFASTLLPILTVTAGLLFLVRRADLSRLYRYGLELCAVMTALTQLLYRHSTPQSYERIQLAAAAVLLLCLAQLIGGLRLRDSEIYA